MKYAMGGKADAWLIVRKRTRPGRIASHILCAVVVVWAGCVTVGAQETSGEQRTSQELERIRSDPLALRDFLKRMPKGGDLHNHMNSAVYAETYIRLGGEDGLCVDTAAKAFTKSQPKSTAEPAAVCEVGDVPAADVPKDQALYNALVDSFSMRGFVPSEGVTGHDHFFGTHAKYAGIDPRHTGEFLHEVTTRAAAQNEQYLELMETPTWHRLNDIAKDLPWEDDFGKMREALLAKGLAEDIPAARAFFDEAENLRNEKQKCGTKDAADACKVETRYIYQVFRNSTKESVFAQTVFGLELAAADPRIVAINFVGDEDDYTSMTDYAEHMRMVGFLRPFYPDVHVSLHAGELAPGLVPPEGLCCHVRQAVEVAKTDRIGHGVDIMYEDRPHDLLKEMAKRRILVEIAFTSNDTILGIKGKEHPFQTYRKFGVPVAITTDDEGVSRIDLTHEYQRAVESYALTYADLKGLVRNSIEYSFLPGQSLWDGNGAYDQSVADCASDTPGTDDPSAPCADFLAKSEKATQQWELERRFSVFENH
jgi:adenosine deaminase